MSGLRFEGVTKEFNDGTVAVRELWLEVQEGEFMILVGPSGCGKTTALRMVAGFEDVTDGFVVLGDRIVNDVEPGHRDVAMVFQNYALFPHMSARDNIAFPLKMRGVARKDVKVRVEETARMLGIEELLERRPHALSGGQRQRVAMGRAIVRRPQAFLMDEPLSNLDAKLRTQMRAEVAKLHRRVGVTTLYVTHDQTEAMTLGSRVAVMRDGVVQQVGPPQELYRTPANIFVARFMGSPPMNLMRGVLEAGALRLAGPNGARPVASDRWPRESRTVLIGVRPESFTEGDAAREALSLEGEIEVVEELGAETLVHFRHDANAQNMAGDVPGEVDETFAARVYGRRTPRPGERAKFHVDADEIYLFDADSGAALVAPVPVE